MFKAKILKDSLNKVGGQRITTFELRYPRFIHSQLLTHRVFSRNARSSRATPAKVFIEAVEAAPVLPMRFGSNKRGMSPGAEVDDPGAAMAAWKKGAERAVKTAKELSKLGVHKQWVNRVLEPYLYMDTVLTGTDFENFFALRTHKDSQDEAVHLARLMLKEFHESKPVVREWHLPYVEDQEFLELGVDASVKCSTARCCRVSIRPFDSSKKNVKKDLDLYKRLEDEGHMSPMDHPARACLALMDYPREDGCGFDYRVPIRSGNYKGWLPWRKIGTRDVWRMS